MHLIHRFKKIGQQKNTEKTPLEGLTIDPSDWFQVFSACLGKMMAVQTACSEQVVKGQDWNLDIAEGFIYFGYQKYPVYRKRIGLKQYMALGLGKYQRFS